MALTRSAVQVAFHLPLVLAVDLRTSVKARVGGQQALLLRLVSLEFELDFLRERIGQTERNKIPGAFTFDVGEVSARMRAAS